MGLKAILNEDQFGELEEGNKAFYAEKDGSYVLDIEGIDDHPNVQSLRNGHRRSKQERDDAKRKAQALEKRFGKLAEVSEDLDLSDAETERLEKLLPYLTGEQDIPEPGSTKPNDIDLDKIKQNARKPLERDLQAATERAEKAESKLSRLIVDSALTSGISEIKVATPYGKAVKSMFRDKVKVVEGDDGEPVAIIDGEYGEMPVGKFLKEWAQTDEGKAFVEGEHNSGGGTRKGGPGGGKIKNPWAPDSWSSKEQARIYREQGRDVARRMAAEHGKKVL